MATAKTVANKIVAVLKAHGEILGEPVIKTKADGFDTTTVCWDGPWEWAIHFGSGDSLYASEFGDYSLKEEDGIQDVMTFARKNGFNIEAITSSQLGIYKD